MEYSVYDLIRILLKKWYVIALCACLLGGGAVFLSRNSYETALQQYESLTEEPPAAETAVGTTKVTYLYQLSAQTDRMIPLFDLYLEMQGIELPEEDVSATSEKLAELWILENREQVASDITSSAIVEMLQKEADCLGLQEPPVIGAASGLPLNVTDHLSVSFENSRKLCLTVKGLKQADARQLIAAYGALLEELCFADYLWISLEELSSEFEVNSPAASAQLTQTVMQEPPTPPSLVRTVGTGGLLGVVLGCAAVLAAAFLKENRPAKTKPQADEE